MTTPPALLTLPLPALLPEIDRLAVEVGLLLQKTGIRLVAAESCTGGWIAQAVTSVPGSSAWFDRGFVTYSNEAKSELLGVAAATLAEHGAVSEAVVKEMAIGAVKNSRAHLSVAVSGVAGPDGGTPEKPVGTVWIAWGQKRGYAEAQLYRLTGDRATVRARSVAIALDGLRQRLSQ
ncbi:MAG: CinA family protein [Pseudomonadota bacterium]